MAGDEGLAPCPHCGQARKRADQKFCAGCGQPLAAVPKTGVRKQPAIVQRPPSPKENPMPRPQPVHHTRVAEPPPPQVQAPPRQDVPNVVMPPPAYRGGGGGGGGAMAAKLLGLILAGALFLFLGMGYKLFMSNMVEQVRQNKKNQAYMLCQREMQIYIHEHEITFGERYRDYVIPDRPGSSVWDERQQHYYIKGNLQLRQTRTDKVDYVPFICTVGQRKMDGRFDYFVKEIWIEGF